MYVVVRKYTIAGSSEELIRRAKEEFVPIIKGLPGFKVRGAKVVAIRSAWER